MSLVISHAMKKFGSHIAVNDVSFSLEKGQVLGLLGRNGAGKSTTLKMLLGLVPSDSGSFTWEGKALTIGKGVIGYLPEERGLYPKIKIAEQLIYFARLEGVSKREAESRLDYWLERFDIKEYKTKLAGELSKGNQQKIQLIATLIHDPDLIILDEPFSGLDPVNADMLSDVIRELIDKKKTIILSSHRMEQIENFCDNICMMKSGSIVLSGSLSEIKHSYGYRYLSLESDKSLGDFLQEKGLSSSHQDGKWVTKVSDTTSANALIQEALSKGFAISNFSLLEPSLHQIFIERVG